jgi:hypothetical protein
MAILCGISSLFMLNLILTMQNFNIELFAPECAVNASFWAKYFFKLMIPVIFLVLFLGIITTRTLILKKLPNIANQLRIQQFSVSQKIVNICSFTIVTFHTLLIATVVQPFDCTKQTDGTFTLTSAPSLRCFDSTWNANLAGVIFFLLLYVVAAPLFLCWIFWKSRYQINSPKFVSKYSLLISSYKPRYFYFELVNMVKKALFVTSTSLISTSQEVKYFLSIVTFMIFLLLKAIVLPYQTKKTNIMSNL